MVDGQRLQHRAAPPFDAMALKEGIALQHIGNQIAVGQHRTLGYTRGATSVLQHRQLVAVQDRRAVWRFCTGLEYGVQLEGARNRERRHHALHIFDEEINQRALGLGVKIGDLGDHDGLDICFRQHRRRGLRHVGLQHHHRDIGVIELMLQLPLGVKRVGIDHHHAGAQRAEADHQILNEVGHLHRDPVAPLEPRALLQPTGKLRRKSVEIGIGQGVPHTAARGFALVGRERLLEERDNRGIGVGIDVAGNLQRIKLGRDRTLDRFRHGVISGNTDGLGMMWIEWCGVNLPPRFGNGVVAGP